jgi:hypothetical protein
MIAIDNAINMFENNADISWAFVGMERFVRSTHYRGNAYQH